jgi:nucleoside-diphosphate-sugar epimerase
MSQQRVIITGGSGFIGTNLVEDRVAQGLEVLNLDIQAPRNRTHQTFWQKVDILDRSAVIQAVSDFKPQVLLHFAARTDLDEHYNLAGYSANIEGVCNVIEAIRATPSIGRVIFASSQLVCRLGYVPKDDYDYNPTTLYGQSKVLGERIIRAADDINAIWTIVRPTSIWGPWFSIPYKNFFETIAKNIYIHPGNIKTLKQWGYIGNAIYQVDKLINAPLEYVHKQLFYLADYQPIDLRVFADQVQKSIGSKPIRTIPNGLLKMLAFIGDIFQKLGWKNPPLTSFRYSNITTPEVQDLEPLHKVVGALPFNTAQGIDRTVQWFKEYNK